MGRPVASDFYQAFRYQVSVSSGNDGFLEPAAGFNNITTPELSVEAAEYRDGITTYTKKYPGVPTVSDATFQKGVISLHADNPGAGKPFLDWILAAINGNEYRLDLTIDHLHRADLVGAASRRLSLYECFPIRVKPDGDLDATSSEIGIREMDVSAERISYQSGDLVVPGTASPSP
jgi:phage tail-like protein